MALYKCWLEKSLENIDSTRTSLLYKDCKVGGQPQFSLRFEPRKRNCTGGQPTPEGSGNLNPRNEFVCLTKVFYVTAFGFVGWSCSFLFRTVLLTAHID